ncbi:LIC_11959 family protein [Leptospira idonii]|uniref:Uncharacterized protein n=1 Tax=Leptospira idonii TaxID=1193500 RepID=A0A4R9M311_9LEPT|nr:hypothetical protein [Leptospira idonii]TGN19198.1 hypothetical protein EHS15_09775 [Leptospira idonii]
MKFLELIFFIFFCLVSFGFTEAQTQQKYTGSISVTEKRIADAKEEYKKTKRFPTEWKLFYKGKEGDFVVFYDWNGQEIHYRYRRNKFDLDGEEFVKDLFQGNPYFIQGEWTGYYFYSLDSRGRRKVLPEKKNLPAKEEEFIDLHTVPIFKLIRYQEIFTDELLY